jgi:hypothetical protein
MVASDCENMLAGTTPDPIPKSLVKPGNADDPQRVDRLEACDIRGKPEAAGAQVENLCHH